MASPHDALHSRECLDEAVRYSEDDRHALERHYRQFFGGDYFRVQHEKVSHKVHVDIYIYGATVDRPYVTLATSGMGAADVSCGEHEEGDFCHPTEMVTYVPHDWDFSSFESQWLMRRLVDTARYPHEMQKIIAKHQTWCMYDEKTGLADALIPGSIFTHWYFRSLIEEPSEIDHLVLSSGRHIDFIWPYPITRHELHFLTQS
ncbi:suppressor of fused domain protein, partial [Saccharothrix yanglingensis]|uniref:suppressor of fused domain protein n=1 Tax=Saccharothrix yanglingensis TaxID=659496 RepID=UPI0027D1FDEA